ncbi:MAG: hypothetical protein HOK41_07945 [Nitrospina sp.]|jgi:hypothetical protein|nr:hypothetical protein [Nitrospina sp.]MBT6717451.1 hypothetical protein [Nitrospina sp.]
MLFPVTVYNADGKVTKMVSKEMLHRRHWKIFKDNEKKYGFQGAGNQTITKELKTKLDLEFYSGSINNN